MSEEKRYVLIVLVGLAYLLGEEIENGKLKNTVLVQYEGSNAVITNSLNEVFFIPWPIPLSEEEMEDSNHIYTIINEDQIISKTYFTNEDHDLIKKYKNYIGGNL